MGLFYSDDDFSYFVKAIYIQFKSNAFFRCQKECEYWVLTFKRGKGDGKADYERWTKHDPLMVKFYIKMPFFFSLKFIQRTDGYGVF